MRMSSRDGSLDLFGEYRRGSDRKPPRGPQGRRRRCNVATSRDGLQVHRRSSGSRLTTFQKLDREMGKFVKSQTASRLLQGGGGPAAAAGPARDHCLHLQASEEDMSCSVRGVRRGVKWKCGWMFEQDSLYWETVRRQNVSGDEDQRDDPWRRPKAGLVLQSEHDSSVSSTCESSASVEYDKAALRWHHCSTDHDSGCSGMELHLRRTHASRARIAKRVDHEAASLSGAHAGKYDCPRGQQKSWTDHEKLLADRREDGKTSAKGWPAVLKAKCEVLQMEKELADQRLRQQCADMAQAAEMAHCLRASVQTILESAKRGSVSAPCTPGRYGVSEDNPCLQQRIQRLQTVNVQRDLEDQAKSFQNRIEKLRLKSQVRSADSSFRSKDLIPKTSRLNNISSTSSSIQVVTSDGEEWAQVQDVLKQLRGKTASLQQSCENWEKRAMFAESKAASLQIEEEKWRVETQKSEEKVKDLERERVLVRASLEEVRNRHALEQSRLLGSGSNHGYTLVLQPIVASHGSTGCRCTASSDCESCVMTCGGHFHQARISGSCQPELTKEATFSVDDTEPGSDPASPVNPLTMAASPSPSPDGGLISETVISGQSGVRHRYEGVLEELAECELAMNSPPKAGAGQTTISVHEIAKTEVEKSLSQKWFKQRPKSRRPGVTPCCEIISVSESRPNLGGCPIPAKLQAGGAGRGFINGQTAALRKPRPVHSGNTRASSPSLLDKRVPLKEIKRNITPSAKTECS